MLTLILGVAEAVDSAVNSSAQAVDSLMQSDTASTITKNAPGVASSEVFPSTANWPMVMLSLIAIIALILLLAWLARRLGGPNFTAQKTMKVISMLPMGARERVALIEVGGQQLLIGITAQSINHLHTFDTPVVTPSASADSDFALKLKSFLLKPPSQKLYGDDVSGPKASPENNPDSKKNGEKSRD